MRYVRDLQELGRGDAASAGGKAANLGELLVAGLPVPPGYCITASAYRAVVGGIAGLAAQIEGLDQLDVHAPGAIEPICSAIRAALRGAAIPDDVATEIAAAHEALGHEAVVAVRSSATAEDSVHASFAGQYTSRLFVRGIDDVRRAVRQCWESLWLERAVRYRHRQHLAQRDAAMAVVVQAMVDAEVAGVLFTADPITGDAERIVIESTWGCGEAVVSGIASPDRFAVQKSTLIVVATAVSDKARMRVDHGGELVTVEVPEARRGVASLSARQAAELARLGVALEAHFAAPQDVEWAIAGDRVAILQARPITASAAPVREVEWDSPIPGARWARISICDSWLPAPLSPLFATTLFPALIEGWMAVWAGDAAAQAANPLLPTPMFGTIHGYAYLRIDFPMSRYPWRTARLVAGGIRAYFVGLERRWREEIHPRHVARLGALRAIDLQCRSDAEVLGLLAEAQQLSGAYWGVIGGLAWQWNAGEWALAKLYRALGVPTADGADLAGHAPLLQGYLTRSLEAEIALYELARSPCPEARPAAASAPAARGNDAAPDLAALCGFLDTYGHQVYNLDFVEPTPAEDPGAIQAALERYRSGRAEDPRLRLRALAERRVALCAAIATRLRRASLRRRLFETVLDFARRHARLRDQVLFDFTLGWPFLRRGYLELGRRLVERNLLARPDDVFFLTGMELAHALTGEPSAAADAARIPGRRTRWEDQKRLLPPRRVPQDARMSLGSVDITAVALFERREARRDATELRGSPVSPGRVTATARTVHSPRDFAKLAPGEVLIAPYITPAWTSLLAIAGAVVTDTGGLLSHGSIVAREYGIPAVMGTQIATKVIPDGTLVTVDGDRGIVSRVAEHAGATAAAT
jgi:pyruvate,water dikinase